MLLFSKPDNLDHEKTKKKEADFKEYASSATIHGLRNVVDPSNGKIRRLVPLVRSILA
jgi:hypothetical protein